MSQFYREDASAPSHVVTTTRAELCHSDHFLLDLHQPQYPSPQPLLEPLTDDLGERCRIVLRNILDGLRGLGAHAERERAERERREKEREWRERDNLRMSRPNEPIPMPYDDGRRKEKKKKDVVPYLKQSARTR